MPKDDQQKKRIILKIMGEEYVLRSSTPPEHMLEVGEHVNQMMEDLAEKHPTMSLQKIAVLASLNLASDLLEYEREKKSNRKISRKAQKKTGE